MPLYLHFPWSWASLVVEDGCFHYMLMHSCFCVDWWYDLSLQHLKFPWWWRWWLWTLLTSGMWNYVVW
jgi:hypothetical protein